MRVMGIINGWVEAPHCWKQHIKRGVEVTREKREPHSNDIVMILFFGIVTFIDLNRK